MQKKILVGFVIVLVIAVAAFLILRNRATSEAKLTVLRDSGEVSFKGKSGEYTPITTEEQEIPNGSFVKTGEDGLAHVVLPDESMISLSSNTEMQVNYGGPTDVFQTLGNAWFRVQKVAGREEFTVETPTTVATVRGTIFGVERSGDDEVVYVTEDKVEIAQLQEEDGKKVKKNVQTLVKDRLANIKEKGKGVVEVVDLPEDKKQTAWFRRNELINREFGKGEAREFIKMLRERKDFQEIDQEIIRNRLQKRFQNTLGVEGEGADFLKTLGMDTSWFGESSEACTYINSSEYKESIAQLSQSREFLGEYADQIIKIIDSAVVFCEDGVIDANEALQLSEIYSQ